MSNGSHHYNIGQWVVHSRYEVGQIKKIENIPLEVVSSGFLLNSTKIREYVLSSPKIKLISALKIFEQAPEDTDLHRNELRIRINETQTDVSIHTTIRLI